MVYVLGAEEAPGSEGTRGRVCMVVRVEGCGGRGHTQLLVAGSLA